MYDESLKIAYEKADEVLKNIKYPTDKMISTSMVIDYVRENCCPEIDIFEKSFIDLKVEDPYGAMMLVELNENTNTPAKATIILNADNDAAFRRFSLFHELGHLVTLQPDDVPDTEHFVVSTHIDYEITNISKEDYTKDAYLLKEQIANIFALRVLMPSRQFYSKIKDFNDIFEVADFFGLTDEAVLSRMMIGA